MVGRIHEYYLLATRSRALQKLGTRRRGRNGCKKLILASSGSRGGETTRILTHRAAGSKNQSARESRSDSTVEWAFEVS